MNLRERIADEIRRCGPIRFSRYMELCLYDPQYGYYSRRREQFGKAGDFYTSSDVHAVFGRLLARQFDEMWRAMDAPPKIEIVEIGPGRGLFAQDVLDWAGKKFWDFRDALTYRLVENSPAVRGRLEALFADRIANGEVSVHAALNELPPPPEHTIFFANEFFDALPLEIVTDRGELRITCDGGHFVETTAPTSAPEMHWLDRYSVQPLEAGRVEARLFDEPYLRCIAERVKRGFVVLIDYGYTREELLAGRTPSTVRAFRQHSISATPYEAPGEQDITAHVNFTALREIGQNAGLQPLSLLTQAQFLMGIGENNQFADAFEDAQLPQEYAKVALQLKHLVTPAGMGEAFQVLLFEKHVKKEKAAQLSGLKFRRSL
jgi:SAM-dependent MidA family methyltransferase